MPGAQDDSSEVGRHLPVERVLRKRLLAQVAALHEAESSIRSGDAEGVHDSRVAARRLQAALAMFRPAVDTGVTEPLADELRWLTRSLGGARDHHVAQERLTALAAREGEAAGLLLGQLRRAGLSLDDDVRHDEAVLALLGSPRYAALTSSLGAFAAEPATTSGAEKDAGPFVRRRVGRDWERLAQRVSLVIEHPPGHMPDEPLHDARKAAKRLRYGLEVAALLWRHKPTRLRKRVHELTDILGERQDIPVTRAFMLQLASQSQAAGEPTFVHGRLDRAEEARGAELEAQFVRLWSELVARRPAWP